MLSDKGVTISNVLLTRYKDESDYLHFRLVTCNETWIYYYNPEGRIELMEWKLDVSPQNKHYEGIFPRVFVHDTLPTDEHSNYTKQQHRKGSGRVSTQGTTESLLDNMWT